MSAAIARLPRRVVPARTLVSALAAAAALGAAAGAAASFALRSSRPAAPALPELHGQAVWAPGSRPVPAFALGAAARGRTAVVAFLGRRCDAGCRAIRQALAQATAQLPASRRPVVVVAGGAAGGLARFAAAFHVPQTARAIFLVDRHGDARTAYSAPFLPGFVARDLATLAAGR